MSGIFGGLRVPMPRGSLTHAEFQALNRLAENELGKRNAAGRVEVFKSQAVSKEHHEL